MLDFKDGKCICGTVTVGERGQIVIPKKLEIILVLSLEILLLFWGIRIKE